MFIGGVSRGEMQFFHQPIRLDPFVQNGTYAQFFKFDFLGGVGERGENDNCRSGDIGAHLANRVQSHPVTHHGVNEQNLWMCRIGACDSRRAIVGETYDGKISFTRESRQNQSSHLEMIVGDKNGDAFHRHRV